ncbi:MAG: class I SAM-dependent methyltransferase [Desulforhopalus sp.]|nr:class I SAM-dependent methyltransferase [Desulforhopalus sp.]
MAAEADPVQPYTIFARIYDQVMGSSTFPMIKQGFEEALRRYGINFRSAADVGCGTGTFLRYLRTYGVPVIGVDSSAAMLAQAADKNRGIGTVLLRQDMRELQLPRRVDLITCNFDTLNYLLSGPQLARTLQRFQANLTAGGHVIFDILSTPVGPATNHRMVQQIRVPGLSTTWRICWSPHKRWSRVSMLYRFKNAANKPVSHREEHVQRWYPRSFVNTALRNAGFRIRGIHDSETSLPATKDSGWLRYIAEVMPADYQEVIHGRLPPHGRSFALQGYW